MKRKTIEWQKDVRQSCPVQEVLNVDNIHLCVGMIIEFRLKKFEGEDEVINRKKKKKEINKEREGEENLIPSLNLGQSRYYE